MNEKTNTILITLGTFLLGGLVGAGLGVLIAPRSGKKTRKLIRHRSEELKDRTVDELEDTRDQALEKFDALSEKTRNTAESVVSRGKEIAESQRANLQSKLGVSR
jgi:gas vesicle protein